MLGPLSALKVEMESWKLINVRINDNRYAKDSVSGSRAVDRLFNYLFKVSKQFICR
jgi:hypothetical protein